MKNNLWIAGLVAGVAGWGGVSLANAQQDIASRVSGVSETPAKKNQGTAVVIVNEQVITAASGEGAVAQTNIAGRQVVVRGTASGAEPSEPMPAPPSKGAARDFVNADLSGRNFAGVQWSGRQFTNVDLSKANLQNADLRNTELVNVSLEQADLRGANLRGAKLVNVDLEGALLEGAIWTHGRRCVHACQ